MSTSKKIIILSGILSAVTFTIALCLHDNSEATFAYDLSIGLFTGAVFSLFVSSIEYISIRKKILFDYLNKLTTIQKKVIRVKPFIEEYALSSLETLKDLFENEILILGFSVQEFDSFSRSENEIFKRTYDILNELKNKLYGPVIATSEMLKFDINGDMGKANYQNIEKRFFKTIYFSDGNGFKSENIVLSDIKKNYLQVMDLYNKKLFEKKAIKKAFHKMGIVMKKKICWGVLALSAFNMLYFIFDYFNIPSSIGLNIANINWDIAALIIGNTVVIGIFLITYSLIDKQQLKKENNQKQSAYLILRHTYEQCESTIESFCDETFRNNFRSFESTKELLEDIECVQVLKYAFKDESVLIDFVKAGVLDADFYETYLEIKLNFNAFLSVAIWANQPDEAVSRMAMRLLAKLNAEEERIERLPKEGADGK